MLKCTSSSGLIRNVLAVASGTAAAQAIVFAFSPLITRIYSPDVFGLQGVFLSLISIFSPIIALRYPMAIITADTETEAFHLSRLSLLIALGMASMFWLIILVGGQTVLKLLGAEGLGALILLLPLALLCVALQDVNDYHTARLGAFRLVGIVEVVQAFMLNLSRVLGGLLAPVAATLVVVTTIGPTLKSTLLRIGTRARRCPAPSCVMSRPETIALLKKHRDFPIYRMPTDVMNALSQSVPVLLLAALFSPATAGLYALTRSVLNLPSNVLGAAVGNVLYVRFAELSRQDQPLTPLLLRSTGALLALAPPIVGLAWFAPQVFSFVFGEEWREAGHYARWMALWIAAMLANIPAVRISPVIGSQRFLLLFNLLLLAARIASIALPWLHSAEPLSAIASFSVVSAIMIAVSMVLILNFTYAFDHSRERPPSA